jgi:hypothetical protein
MRTTSILLALVVVLGFVSEAGAAVVAEHDFTVTIGGKPFGFRDCHYTALLEGLRVQSVLCLGPFGYHEIPFTATQGLVGFCMIVVGMLALVTVGTVRWKRKSSTT